MKKSYLIQHEKATLKLSGLLLVVLFFLAFNNRSNAQLSGWMYKDGIKVTEHTGTQQLNYQVLLNINTAALISANKMQAGGEDIRFSKDCAGATLLSYFIESGINTANTQIWVMLDTLKANGDYGLYMWYGNATATAGSDFNSAFPLSTQLIVPSGTVTLSGTNTYSWFEIKAGAGVNVSPNSPLVINARRIIQNGTINGRAAGELGGGVLLSGNGAGGGVGANSGGGGAYGGAGGKGDGNPPPSGGNGGIVYGTNNAQDIAMGSGGGGGNKGNGGNGGGSVTLNAAVLDMNGVINLDGDTGIIVSNSGSYGGGGGSGGGLLIKAHRVTIAGTIYARGGKGGQDPNSILWYTWGGGGGGGGRIKIFYDNAIANTAVQDVSPGLGGQSVNNVNTFNGLPGSPGTTYQGTYVSNEPTYVFLPHVVLNAGSTTFCQGTATSFTASTGFSPYDFQVNGDSAQNTTSNTFSSSTLNNNDTVRVLGTDANGCADTSNSFIVTVNPSPTVSINPASASYCAPGSAGLTASGANTYTWSPPTDLSSTSGPNVTASPTVTTQYTVAATDMNGCMDSDTVTVTVNNCTGVNSIHVNAFSVYPNPTNGNFVINANFSEDTRLELKNALGQTVLVIEEHTLTGLYKKEVSASTLPDGVYFLCVKTKSGSQIKKVIKN